MEIGSARSVAFIAQNQLQKFRDQGYLVCPGILDPNEDLLPVRKEYEMLLDRVADGLFLSGEISSKFELLEFDKRICAMYEEMGSKLHTYLDISLPQKDVEHKTPVHTGPAVFNLITNTKLLNLLEGILGSELYSNPTQHVRIKPPAKYTDNGELLTPELTTTVWHQDLGTVSPEADESDIVTVWIPFTEANKINGCLLVAPGSHKRGLAVHCHDHMSKYSRQAIPDSLVGKDRKALEMFPGDVLIFDKMTMHASLPNFSQSIRWSFDLRYQKIGWPTGRPSFPGFVVRSKTNPSSVLSCPEEWAQLWKEARQKIISDPPGSFQRWREGHPDCA